MNNHMRFLFEHELYHFLTDLNDRFYFAYFAIDTDTDAMLHGFGYI